jgi:hypothetical protein
MKHVAGNQHDVRRKRDRFVDHARERRVDVSFALIHTSGGQPLVLAKSEMWVGEMD